MSGAIISVERLGKRYRISHQREKQRYTALRDVISQKLFAPLNFLRRRPKPEAKNQSAGFRTAISGTEDFWAIKDVSFEVKQGEVVGIIGRNGAGKSTLLKILSRITEPTTGRVVLKGRVASLLEVGTGFHPELTGRENIFLNGAILGMQHSEIKGKFDQIVAFAEVEKFLDTPVKRYSSGMYVRLAFAVAAHLEPEILIVDEVLAVGDGEFQKKCLGKLREVSSSGGRTVLFVSHNMQAITSLCSRVILLDNGQNSFDGSAAEGVHHYLIGARGDIIKWNGSEGDESAFISETSISAKDDGGFFTDSALIVSMTFAVTRPLENLVAGFTLRSEFGYDLAYCLYNDYDEKSDDVILPGVYTKRFKIPSNTLTRGNYQIIFDVGIHMVKRIVYSAGALQFTLNNRDRQGCRYILPEGPGLSSLFRPNWFVNEREVSSLEG